MGGEQVLSLGKVSNAAVGIVGGKSGQAPSDRPEYARFLVEAGIDSISVTPDSFVAVKRHVAAAESGEGRREPLLFAPKVPAQ